MLCCVVFCEAAVWNRLVSSKGAATVVCTVQYSTVQYSTAQYSTVQYSTVQYKATGLAAFLVASYSDSGRLNFQAQHCGYRCCFTTFYQMLLRNILSNVASQHSIKCCFTTFYQMLLHKHFINKFKENI